MFLPCPEVLTSQLVDASSPSSRSSQTLSSQIGTHSMAQSWEHTKIDVLVSRLFEASAIHIFGFSCNRWKSPSEIKTLLPVIMEQWGGQTEGHDQGLLTVYDDGYMSAPKKGSQNILIASCRWAAPLCARTWAKLNLNLKSKLSVIAGSPYNADFCSCIFLSVLKSIIWCWKMGQNTKTQLPHYGTNTRCLALVNIIFLVFSVPLYFG